MKPGSAARAVARLLPASEAAQLRRIRFRDRGHGYDAFGLEPGTLRAAIALLHPFYRHYFRVESFGAEHVPQRGAAILVANHSGMLPIDGALLVTDVLLNTDPPRVPRAVGDVFIPFLPWIGTLLSRLGVVIGSRGNFSYLLETGELLLVFPEGTRGIGKGYQRRYQLQQFRVGHAELAIRHRAPVIPVGVVGAEEAWPQLGKLQGVHWFGAPHLPIPASPLPLPAKIQIHYGEPLALHERWAPSDADDAAALREAADLVKSQVNILIQRGLSRRRGVFR